ncbi:MAG TPA: SDR family NAD(P)-dependent oxidoreductase [Pyrinomonadaceae bacterium]|jgi:NAD(P)-dependent dehydrogenase (short-subunit alcohol dehydrogenase family)
MFENKNSLLFGAAVGVGALSALAAFRKSRRAFNLKNKVVLITGGSRGLGLVLAREFAAEGARIAICARDGAELAAAKEDLESLGAEVFDAICDVTNQEEINHLIGDVCIRFGQIDVLVNNAGVIQVGPLSAQTEQDFEEAMNIHFWAPYRMIQTVLPVMRGAGTGRIINIASIGGKIAVPHLTPYCASKFALVGLSSALHIELAKENIFVTTVCPGLMRTGSHVNAYFKGQNEKEYALFSISNALPVSSVSAESAARQIVRATKRGDAEAIISPQAKFAAKFNALFPEIAADILSLVNRLLPSNGGIGIAKVRGKESESWLAPSILTALSDKEIIENNEQFAN